MSVQYLIKYNLWERNSSSPSVPLCKQDLLFTSSAKILSCDQKKRCQNYLLCRRLYPDCDQWVRRWRAGSLLYSCNSFHQQYLVCDPRKVCSCSRGGYRQSRALQTVLRHGEWDTWLLYPSEEAEVKPELWKYNLNQGRHNSCLYIPALWSSFRGGKKTL